MPSNSKRAQWADRALTVFQVDTRCDREDALPDLLCDLMHLAEQQGWDFGKSLDRARLHHEAELADPEPEFLPRPQTRRPSLHHTR